MKLLFASLSFAILSLFAVASCKNSDADPRDQYVGSYDVTGNTSFFQIGTNATPMYSSGNDVLIVSKGQAEKDLVFSFSKNRLTATLSDGGYFFPSQSYEASASNGTKYYQTYDGSGTLSSGSIEFTATMNATVSGSKIREITVVKGYKK